MAWGIQIEGFKEVLVNLNREINNVENRSVGGLIEGARIIWEDVERTEPATPLDTGNLRNSRFTVTATGIPTGQKGGDSFKDNPRTKLPGATMHADHTAAISEAQGMARASEGGKKGKFLIMGYSARYAAPVHEDQEAKFFTPRTPPAGPKWFERAFHRNTKNIVEAVRKHATIKK